MKKFPYTLSKLTQIAAGGEGTVYEIDKNTVLKYYHTARPASFEKHLKKLQNMEPSFVSPIDIYGDGNVVGYTMKYVDYNNFFLFNNLFNKSFCDKNNITVNFKVTLLKKLINHVEFLHRDDIIVGDLNEYNMMFDLKGSLIFVDTDSYQTSVNPHSGVVLEDIRDFLNPIGIKSDMWAYTILAFRVLTYVHPFKWVIPGDSNTLESRVRKKMSYLNTPGIKIPKLYNPPTGSDETNFEKIFDGARFWLFPGGYAVATETYVMFQNSQQLIWKLVEKEVLDIFGDPTNLSVVKNVERIVYKATSKDVYSIKAKILDETLKLLPGDDNIVIVKSNHKFVWGQEFSYHEGLQYYYNGGVAIVDHNGILYSFDAREKIRFVNQVPCYTKSFILRDALIQNFGLKKFIILPVKSDTIQIEVPASTKNAYVSYYWACIEYVENNKIKYKMLNIYTKKTFEVDYFSYFTAKDNVIFIPNDGYIDMYDHMGNKVQKLEIDVCTRSSKLHMTIAGIFLLESKGLYIVNTK